MVRRHHVGGVANSEATATFGVPQPTFYFYKGTGRPVDGWAHRTASRPERSQGRSQGTAEVIAFVTHLKAAGPN
jgi:hypothetical protein